MCIDGCQRLLIQLLGSLAKLLALDAGRTSLDGALDAHEKLVEVHWFSQVVLGPRLERPHRR